MAAAGWTLCVGPLVEPVRVRGDDRSLLAALAPWFGASPPRPSDGRAPSLRLSGRLTPEGRGVVVTCPGTQERTTCAEFGRLVATIDEAVDHLVAADAERPYCFLHASAVETRSSRAVLLLGRSGSGKSTTAVAWHRRGARWLADECVAVRVRAPGVLRWRRPIALRPDVDAWLGSAADGASLRVGVKRYRPPPESRGRDRVVPLGALVVLDAAASATEPEALDAADALAALVGSCHMFAAQGRRRFHELATLAQRVPAWRLAARDGWAVVDRLARLP